MSEPTLKLPRAADELLQSFPAGEPDFEAQAKEIEARLATGVANAGVTFDPLLAAPALEAEAGEPAATSEVRAAPVPKSNFAEMARRSLQKKDSSAGLTKEELLAATAQRRRPDAELVERVRAAGRAAAGTSATGTPLPSSSREPVLEEAARPSGVVARAQPTSRAAAPPANQRGTIIGIVGVTIGVAACIALFLETGNSESPTSATLAGERAEQAAAVPPSLPPAPVPTTQSSEGVTTPEALAAAPRAVAAVQVSKVAPNSAVAAAPAAGKAAAPASGSKPKAVVLEDDPAPVAAAEPKPAPAAPEPQLKPAQGASGDVPLTPSAGAVSTALNSVRGGAQACLAGQTEAVTAVVTFASDGHVLRVSASGPSGACIQAALAKAHITPFARDSFTATTTIRPP